MRTSAGSDMPPKIDARRDFYRTITIVDEEIAMMRFDHAVAQQIRALLVHPDQGLLRMGHFFFNRLWSWYLRASMTAVRAQIRHNRRPQLSLGGVLRKIPEYVAIDPSWFASPPTAARCEELLTRLEAEAMPACAMVDQRIAHRDLEG